MDGVVGDEGRDVRIDVVLCQFDGRLGCVLVVMVLLHMFFCLFLVSSGRVGQRGSTHFRRREAWACAPLFLACYRCW